jgi:Putative Ig domain
MLSSPASGTTLLTSGEGILLLWLTAGGLVAIGILVIIARRLVDEGDASRKASSPGGKGTRRGQRDQAGSVIRSWLAVSLVFALVVFSAAAFLIDDDTVRSLLWGGLIASAGTALAFYFSSKSADQARADFLGAAVTLAQGPTKPTAFSQATPPNGTAGQAYPGYKFIADGHPAPTYYYNGALPPGLTLGDDGTLQGQPEAGSANTYKFTVGAFNTAGSITTAVTITIN